MGSLKGGASWEEVSYLALKGVFLTPPSLSTHLCYGAPCLPHPEATECSLQNQELNQLLRFSPSRVLS